MGAEKYVIALDQGTTSSRAALIDRAGRMVDVVQRPFQQIFPQPGWVEHNPQEILFSQLGSCTELIARHGLTAADVAAIGIDNQRETTIVWDPATGAPVCNAIVWQCRRTADMVERICGAQEVREMVRAKTGLLPDAYFSASKIAWILENVPGARERAEAGELLFGTVDTWLVWVLTGGLVHATDPTNASRTMLYNIHEGRWDEELLALFGIPASMMPEVRPSSGLFGETSYPGLPAGIPIMGVAGDQQAALFGQCCFAPGEAKNTYGTGCFMLLNTGGKARTSEHGLVTTIAAAPPDATGTQYALEGSVFVAGALILLAMIAVAAFFEKFMQLFSSMLRFDSNGRDGIWESGLKQFAGHPLFGVGFYECEAFRWGQLPSDSFLPPRYHNTYLQLMASGGVVALLAYAFHRFQTVRLLWRRRTRENIFLAFIVLALILTSTVDCHFFNFGPGLLYSVILVFIERGSPEEKTENTAESAEGAAEGAAAEGE